VVCAKGIEGRLGPARGGKDTYRNISRKKGRDSHSTKGGKGTRRGLKRICLKNASFRVELWLQSFGQSQNPAEGTTEQLFLDGKGTDTTANRPRPKGFGGENEVEIEKNPTPQTQTSSGNRAEKKKIQARGSVRAVKDRPARPSGA